MQISHAGTQQETSSQPHPEKQAVLPANRPLASHDYVTFLADPENKILWIAYPAKELGPEMVNLQPHVFLDHKQAWEPVYSYNKIPVSVYELNNVLSCGTVDLNFPAVILHSQFVEGDKENGRCEFSPALLVPGARINLSLNDQQREQFETYAISSFLKAGFLFLGSDLFYIEKRSDSAAAVTTVGSSKLPAGLGQGIYQLAQASTNRFYRFDSNDIEEMLAKLSD